MVDQTNRKQNILQLFHIITKQYRLAGSRAAPQKKDKKKVLNRTKLFTDGR